MSTYGTTEYNERFGERLRTIMYKRGKTPAMMAKDLKISKGSISNWTTGKRLPRANAMNDICRYLGCTRADLLEEEKPGSTPPKHSVDKTDISVLSPEAVKIAEQIDKNESLRLLFSVAVGSTPEDIKLAMDILWRIKHVMQNS